MTLKFSQIVLYEFRSIIWKIHVNRLLRPGVIKQDMLNNPLPSG